MSTFTKTEKTLYQIKNLLLANSNLKKLLYNMVPNALVGAVPSVANVSDLIKITPYIEDENGIEESYRNAFIIIYPSAITIWDGYNTVNLVISCFVNQDYYELDEEKIRVLSIFNEIEKTLNHRKLEFSGKIELTRITMEIIDVGKFVGYNTDWEITDGQDADY